MKVDLGLQFDQICLLQLSSLDEHCKGMVETVWDDESELAVVGKHGESVNIFAEDFTSEEWAFMLTLIEDQ